VITTSIGYASIRHRAVEQHREWVIRRYVVTFALVTFRLLDQLSVAGHVAKDTEVSTMMAFACWAVPLLVVEPLLTCRNIVRRNRSAMSPEGNTARYERS
jgi:hypothetical protein